MPSLMSRRERHSWLSKKAAHDSQAGATAEIPNPSGLWMVHGRWYDLQPFIQRHPGGSFWLRETQGMDITEL